MTIDLSLTDIENIDDKQIEKVHRFLKSISKTNYDTLVRSMIVNELITPERYKSFLTKNNIEAITTEEELNDLLGEDL